MKSEEFLISLPEGLSCYFFHCQKSNHGSTCSPATKCYSSPTNASRAKNSLIHSSIYWASRFAGTPVPISLIPLSGFMAGKWTSGKLGQFWGTSLLPIRNDFFLIIGMFKVPI